MKISFCDLNRELVDWVEKLFKKQKRTVIELVTHCGDIIQYHNEHWGRIATASNPEFRMWGGLDGLLARTYPEQCKRAAVWVITEDLIFCITVDHTLTASWSLITESLAWCFKNADKHIIISWFWTGIGGMSIKEFLTILEYVLVFVSKKWK